MSLIDHARTDLAAQRDAPLGEFQAWRQRTGPDPGRALARHHTQIVRITDTLTGALDKTLAGTPLAEHATSATRAALRLEELADLRRDLGSVHLLWDFFRDKLAQRESRLFTDHLGAADHLAWHLYRLFWERAVSALERASQGAPPSPSAPPPVSPARLKEPPLVFYHVERNFLAQPRVSSFSVPGLSGKDIEKFYYVLRNLPVPIIGLPWYQAGRVPALVFVAHEVGHVVAEDLDLDEAFDGLLEGLDLGPEPTRVWRAWSGELFADLVGTLALGAAYVQHLAVELAAGFDAIIGEPVRPDDPGRYPTRALRLALCAHALELVGAPLERPFFARDYPIGGDSDRYIDHVPAVVQALVRGPYHRLGGAGLDAILAWRPALEAQVESLAQALLDPTGDPATATRERAIQASDPAAAAADQPILDPARLGVAAAAYARLRDPAAYARRALDTHLAHILANPQDTDPAQQGRALRERLFQVASPGGFTVRSTLASLDRARGTDLALSLSF